MSDTLVAVAFIPIAIAAGAWNTIQIWGKRRDYSDAVGWATGSTGRAGFHASMLTTTAGFASAGIAVGAAQIWDPGTTPWGAVPIGFFVLSLLALATSAFLFLFMRPRFLVPPHLRGEDGWLPATWKSMRDKPTKG